MAASIGTWSFSQPAVQAACSQLVEGRSAVDALTEGIAVVEADPGTGVYVVGRGGFPNADGILQCDAAVMDGKSCSFGAVAALEGVNTPIKVALDVMRNCPHNVLAGPGAQTFARNRGFHIYDNDELLTEHGKTEWKKFVAGKVDKVEMAHDTLALITRDQEGNIAAGVSSSGIPFKLPGRVGDSPLPGAGLYADSRSGAACCTGDGDHILRFCPAIQVVNLLQQGAPPDLACEKVIQQIKERLGQEQMFEIAIIAMDSKGNTGAGGSVRTWTDIRSKVAVNGFPYTHWKQSDSMPQISVTKACV